MCVMEARNGSCFLFAEIFHEFWMRNFRVTQKFFEFPGRLSDFCDVNLAARKFRVHVWSRLSWNFSSVCLFYERIYASMSDFTIIMMLGKSFLIRNLLDNSCGLINFGCTLNMNSTFKRQL